MYHNFLGVIILIYYITKKKHIRDLKISGGIRGDDCTYIEYMDIACPYCYKGYHPDIRQYLG